MKKVRVDNKVKLIGKKNFTGSDKLIDYYFLPDSNERIYAFSKAYTNNSYDLCKAGIRINDLTQRRSHDTGIMRLVKYTKFILPYLAEEYELPMAQ